MKQKWVPPVIAIVAGVIVFWLMAKIIVSMAIVVVAAIVAGVVAGVVASYVATSAVHSMSSSQGAPPAPDPAEELTAALESLLALNLDLRVASLTGSALSRIEELIDRLAVLLSALYADFQGSASTREVRRIATEYVPEFCRRFAAFSEEERAAKQIGFEERLGEIEAAVGKIEKAAADKNAIEFAAMGEFLKFKF